MNTKKCHRCQQVLSIDEFAKNRAKKDGLQERCNSCRKTHYKQNGKPGHKHNWLMKKYNVSLDWYNETVIKQKNLCLICNQEQSGGKGLAVDHCHKTGKVRGLLCDKCNTSIGLMRESVDILKSAIKYLEEHNE